MEFVAVAVVAVIVVIGERKRHVLDDSLSCISIGESRRGTRSPFFSFMQE